MSAHYLRGTILVVVVAFLLTSWVGPVALFLPLLSVIQDISSDANEVHFSGSGVPAIVVSITALLASIAAVALTARGVAIDRTRRWVWVILLVVGVLVLLQAAALAFLGPRFQMLLRDLKS